MNILATVRAPRSATGLLMVDSFNIVNFRGFDDIEVDECRRINIVVGDNGSGKTALLEALFLALGASPEIALRSRSWRGFDANQLAGTPEDLHEALWGDLFHKFQVNKAALISLKGKGQQHRSVSVHLHKRGSMRAVPPRRDRPGATVQVVPQTSPIEFKWKIRGLPDLTVAPQFQENRLIFPPMSDAYIKASFYSSNRTPPTNEMANHFSNLSKSFLESEFVDRFNQLFPTIRSLSIEVNAGVPMVYGAVEGMPQKLPLGLASSGMNKLAAILLGMTEQSGGVILIDELENGFYYDRLPMVWDAILQLARLYDCQVFASTHSAECLNAAARLAEKNPQDFCILRTVFDSSGSKIRTFDGERFADAVLANIEVR